LFGLLSKTKNADTTKPPPAKTLRFGLCICVKNMCSIQFPIMVAQTDVPVNAFEKILSGLAQAVVMRYVASWASVYTNAQNHGSRRCRKP